ncbi:hypothetical protein [uncultured Gammaproteobacteria bacterium]|nr:hypothetical protein [uncultured Gammaproteobacteria bacterium]CAC9615241.1 hypothetical protein [uncultured Gammaproteobacteria bacterium]
MCLVLLPNRVLIVCQLNKLTSHWAEVNSQYAPYFVIFTLACIYQT